MSIYKMSKIVLALLLSAGCLTTAGTARAADETKSTSYTYTFTPNGSDTSSTGVTAATVSVSVSTTTSSYTYTDANGVEQTIEYTTVTETPTVSVDVTSLPSLTSLTYDSPNATTGSETTDTKYYAWELNTETGTYEFKALENSTGAQITISYVTSDETSSHTGITNVGEAYQDSSSDTSAGNYNDQNISADFVADHHNESSAQGGGAIFNNGMNADVSLGTITGNFIGNYETSAGSGIEGGAITNLAGHESSFAGEGNTAKIDAIAGNFIGNYVSTTATDNGTDSAMGGAVCNYARTGNATIGSITGDFVGNYATATGQSGAEASVYARGGAIFNYTNYTNNDNVVASIGKIEGNFIGNYVESSGGSSTVASGGGAIYTNSIIGQTDESGNLILTDKNGNATVAISGSFIGNYAKTTQGGYAYGGAIFSANGGKIGNIQADFIGNYAEATTSGAYGGAINNNGTIADVGSSTTKSNFIGNYVNTSGEDFAQGGAIYNTGTFGDITADFIGNSATTSGTYALGGAINNNNGTINSLAGDFIGNSAKSEGENEDNSYAWGGAIYNTGKIGYVDENGTASTTVAITGNFISNSATSQANDSYGGAIYNNGTIGTTTETDGSVSVTVDGISDSSFIANTAARGGAIYNGTDKTTAESGDGGDTGDTDTTYTGIISSITNTQFIQNVATRYGGAIYNYADGAIYNITNNDFVLNEAQGGNGGAIENAEATSYIGTISGNNFMGNKVNETSHGGGAIYSEGIIDDLADNVFVENESGTYGGAIYNHGGTIGTTDESGNVLTGITGSTFQGNTSGRGGAIYNTAREITDDDGNVTDYEANTGYITSITGNYFVKNVATAYGGAIYNYHGASIGEIANNYFIENEAENGNGGAIENAESDAYIGSITGNVFSKNKVTTSSHGGGAIYNEGIIGDLTGNTFDQNESGNFGGAIYNHGGTIGTIGGTVTTSGNTTIYSSAFTGNTSERGGAIYNVATEVTGGSGTTYTEGTGTIEKISGNYFKENIASAFGGAIYNYHGGTIGEISSNYFEANEAQDGNGGAVENAESDAVIGKMDGNTFVNNKATGNGGAIYNEGTIGSASYTDSEGTTVNVTGGITDSTFSGNEATSGGAIYNAGSTTGNGGTIAGITGSTFTSNSAKSTDGDAQGGAIYNAGTIGGIEITTLSGNTAEGVTSAAGGAIYNAGTIGDESSGTISVGLISSNYAKATGTDSSATALGGAIYNTDTSAEIAVSGSIANNYADATGGDAQGGAIYTKGDVTVTITQGGSSSGYIQNNYAKATGSEGSAQGGAIYSEGTLNVTATSLYGNYATSTNGDASGGAIYNTGTLGSIALTNLSNNYAEGATSAAGGGIYNSDSGSSEGKISVGTISENYAKATGTSATGAAGGAIYNDDANAEIDVTGSIASNYAQSAGGDAQGGAIYTKGDVNISEDEGAVYLQYNYAKATGSEGSAQGGAIYSEGALNVTATSLYGNYAEGVTKAEGGAIYHSVTGGSEDGEISVVSISSNHATASGSSATAQGGAIYNDDASTTINVTGSITNNYASAESGSAQGGAIYTNGDVNVTAENGSSSPIYIKGNYVQSSDGKDDNAIYMASKEAAVNFTLSNDSSIFLYDNIQGETGYGVNISGDGLENVFYLLNDVEGSNLSVGAALTSPDSIKPLDEPAGGDSGDDSETETVTGNLTLSTTLHDIKTDEVHTYKVNSFTVAGNFNMEADVDLKTETMDHFETANHDSGGTYDEAQGNLNVSDMWGLSDTDKDKVAVYFAETGLMENVTSTVSTVKAPVHEYSVAYIYKDDEGIHHDDEVYTTADSALMSSKDNGGYFVFSKGGFNPAVMTPSIAVMGAYGAFGMIFDYNFEHSDYYMKLPENVRLAMSEESENAEKAPRENDATRPEYYNQHELTYHGAWSRTFFSNESIDYGGGWDSRDKYYGAMFGFDTDMKFHDNGWANVTTGYVGTMGIRQQFSGGHIKQHGGFVGVTESFYKKNFYNAWTIAAGFTKAHEHTMYGHDKDRIDEYGIATRLGWNIRLGHDEKFTLLPTFTASFSYIHPEDFTNAANVHIAGSGFRAVQLNPNVKLLWNRDDGWQPYVTLGEVWTVADSIHLRANGEKLDELDLDPYTEYGIGVQKRWAYDRDAYIQFLGHSHGRDGFLVNAGIRWNF